MRILSGVQSSGRLHLGNYYGAIRQFVEMQHHGEALYFIANLHALNVVHDAATARQLTLETAMAFLALGIDPERAALFRQSDIPEVTELFWVLGTLVPMANLERAHSYRDKLENKKGEADFGLFAYPVLMAADILLYDSDVVPVGKDQKQHLEFTRDWATKFNVEYCKGYDPQKPEKAPGVFKLPKPLIQEATATILGTDGRKMSKSYGNTIDLFGDIKPIEKAMKSVKTDSTPVELPKPLEEQPLYELLKVMLPPSEFETIDAEWKAGGKGYGHFKGKLLEAYHAAFDGPRKRYDELAADPAEVERLLKKGAEKARSIASPVVARMRQAVGL